MSVVSVQDLNASTRMTAQNALTHSLSKKTVREIQIERVKLGEYLGVRLHLSYNLVAFHCVMSNMSNNLFCSLQMDINELTRPWGLEVDRVELTLGSLLKAPEEDPSGPLIMSPSVPGLEGLTGPIQQLAMHFLSHSSSSKSQQGMTAHSKQFFFYNSTHYVMQYNTHMPLSLQRIASLLQMSLAMNLHWSWPHHVLSKSCLKGSSSCFLKLWFARSGPVSSLTSARKMDNIIVTMWI